MDTISHSETSLLGKFNMHQGNNAPFMTKNLNFAVFPWTLLGHSEKNTDQYFLEVAILTRFLKEVVPDFFHRTPC